jgi:hypothetical protein
LTEDERSFLQHRVGAFGLVGTSCYGFFLIFRSGMACATGQLDEFRDPSFWYGLRLIPAGVEGAQGLYEHPG